MFANLLKFILGFILAIAILIGGGVVVGLYFMNRSSIAPPKPIFANDNPELKPTTAKETEAKPKTTAKSKPTPTPTPTPTSTSTPTPTPTPTPTETQQPLPPGAYHGRVTWPQGLSLRAQPQQETERVGGVGFNEKIIVLEESDDKAWQKIRVVGTNQEGWVKAGNTERAEEQDDTQQPQDSQEQEQR